MTGTTGGLRRVLALLGMLALALAGVVGVSPGRATAASNVQVFLGYADNLRANPANFPTPWDGSPGVTFAGCHGGCTFDGGAARFVNNSPVSVTIDSVQIKLSTCTFDMWPHGTVLAPGQQLIVAQTAGGASSGCDNTHGLMDTSDIGPNGANWAGNCTQSGVIPVVDASINGVANVFTDSGQVLNTGGVDKASCPSGSNESTQWTSVGSLPCPGATLTLAPASQTQAPGATATVKATLANTCGVGLQGASVKFAIASGPNAGLTGTAVTDPAGVATFSYTSTATGTDTLGSSTANPAGTITSNNATVLWQQRQSHLAITGGASTSDYNDPATVAATLTDTAGPLAGQPVTFALNGAQTCTGTTNASGVASCAITPGEPAGTYTLTASYAGDAADTGTTASAPFTVTLEETALTYTGPTKAANGTALTLSGVLTEDGTTPIAGRTVSFTLGTGSTAQSCTGTTSATGQASCTIASVNQPAASTTVPVNAAFAGDTYYKPAAAAAALLKFNYLTGRAYGLASTGLVGISPTPDTGSIQTAVASNNTPPCVATVTSTLGITAHTLCASVVTAVNPGTSTATASVQDATIGVAGLPVIQIGAVQSSSQSVCSAASGAVNIASITVGGVPLNIGVHPGPNTTVTVAGITLILNEQVPVPGADQGLTVNAVHIKAAPLGLGLLDVTIASATSDIHNC